MKWNVVYDFCRECGEVSVSLCSEEVDLQNIFCDKCKKYTCYQISYDDWCKRKNIDGRFNSRQRAAIIAKAFFVENSKHYNQLFALAEHHIEMALTLNQNRDLEDVARSTYIRCIAETCPFCFMKIELKKDVEGNFYHNWIDERKDCKANKMRKFYLFEEEVSH